MVERVSVQALVPVLAALGVETTGEHPRETQRGQCIGPRGFALRRNVQYAMMIHMMTYRRHMKQKRCVQVTATQPLVVPGLIWWVDTYRGGPCR